jgi:hypothetical protein
MDGRAGCQVPETFRFTSEPLKRSRDRGGALRDSYDLNACIMPSLLPS